MKESDLFNILKITHVRDLQKSENQYSRFDCFSEKYKMDIELKCRNKHYEELLIEKDKYEALITRSEKYETNGQRWMDYQLPLTFQTETESQKRWDFYQ